MLYCYVIPSFITGIITFSWYSLYGLQFFRGGYNEDSLSKPSIPNWRYNVPVYMWELYKNGIGGNGNSRADIVKGVYPKFLGRYFSSQNYPNHGRQEIEFNVPETADGETLMDAEIRIMTKEIKPLNVSFQIFHKGPSWLFLDVKATPSEGVDWISLSVMSSMKMFKRSYSISFLIVTVFRELNRESKDVKYWQPFLLLSYINHHHKMLMNHTKSTSYFQGIKSKSRNSRRKRNLADHYEEETNRIWKGTTDSKKKQKGVNICTRIPLYIEFSDINYDTWIVAPTGYEAFQCVGKCTFPVGEHLSPTNHAIIQTLLHYVSPTEVARACCVPTRLDPISILYIDNNGILTYQLHYHGMVVAECGCR